MAAFIIGFPPNLTSGLPRTTWDSKTLVPLICGYICTHTLDIFAALLIYMRLHGLFAPVDNPAWADRVCVCSIYYLS